MKRRRRLSLALENLGNGLFIERLQNPNGKTTIRVLFEAATKWKVGQTRMPHDGMILAMESSSR